MTLDRWHCSVSTGFSETLTATSAAAAAECFVRRRTRMPLCVGDFVTVFRHDEMWPRDKPWPRKARVPMHRFVFGGRIEKIIVLRIGEGG